ncbi:CBD9-like protein [Thozetella sp. PMI_491]|nr:CBD9-like protein [Thozetella sp. PMI_491]
MSALASLAAALFAAAAVAQNPTASPYTDTHTGILFQGFQDGTGYQFGIAMPKTPSSDFIVQLMSPLTNGAGWAGVDFGSTMSNFLLLVAWPNGNDVMISPRYARGYAQSDTVVYTANPITLQPIAKGTFVNGTHVAATFVCQGCINADSFAASAQGETFAYAYSSVAVNSPSNPSTLLSDHTAHGEPYGSFSIALTQAYSDQYPTWAALAATGSTSASAGGATATATKTAPGNTAAPTTPTGASTTSPSGSDTDEMESDPSLGGFGIATLTFVGLLYVLQAFDCF